MTLQEFLRLAVGNPNIPDGIRRGQFAFNLLNLVRPDLADQIRGTGNDPFYDNNVIPRMLAWVATNWDGV